MNIDGVKTGIVLDHIKAGKSMQIYELLGLDKINNCVAIIQNADSRVNDFGKVMGRDIRRHTDGDTLTSVHQKVGKT